MAVPELKPFRGPDDIFKDEFMECRVCLQKVEDGCPLSTTVVEKDCFISLDSILSQVCMVNTDVISGFPDVLCVECREGLLAAYKLILLAQDSDLTLRLRFSGQNEGVGDEAAQPTMDEETVIVEEHEIYEISEMGEDEEAIVEEESIIQEDEEQVMEDGEIDYSQMQAIENEPEEPTKTNTAAKLKSPKKSYKCAFCNKAYQSLNLFAGHTKAMHPEHAIHVCKICSLAYPQESLLNEHLKQHQDTRKYKCPHCEKIFKQSIALKAHIRSHKGERPWLCPICGKGFFSQNNLRQHLQRHNTDKRFLCDLCPGTFATKASLTTHRRIHTGVKPYQCTDCDAAFNSHFSWSKHKRIHSGEKPYVCEVCGMRFNSSYHVNRHLRTHTGEKPYKCEFCDRSFAQSNDLVKHKRSHLGKNTYLCTECPETFRLHGELRAHISKHFIEKKRLSEGTIKEVEGEDIIVSEVEVE